MSNEHGMVLVALEQHGYLATCLCGWFASKSQAKPDMAAYLWRLHDEQE